MNERDQSCVYVPRSTSGADVVWCSHDNGSISAHVVAHEREDVEKRAEMSGEELASAIRTVIGLEITLPVRFLPSSALPWLLSSSHQLVQLGLMLSTTASSVEDGAFNIVPQQAFNLPFRAETVNKVKCCHDVLCVHNQQKFIDCFSLTSRLLLRHVDLRQTSIDAPITDFSLSPNCGTISLVSEHRLVIHAFPEKRAKSHRPRSSNTPRSKFRTSPFSFPERSSSRTSAKRRAPSTTSLSSLDSTGSERDSLIFDLSEYVIGEFEVEEMVCSTLKTSVLCRECSDEATETLFTFDHQNSTVASLQTEEKETIVFSSDSSLPHLVLGQSGVCGVCANDQEERKMLERWNAKDWSEVNEEFRSPALSSAQNLDVGLRHKQMDTVAFYLSNREQAFVSATPENLTIPWRSQDVSVFESYIKLLKTTIEESKGETPTYANEIISLTLRHLHNLLHHVTRTGHGLIGRSDDVIAAEKEDVTVTSGVVDALVGRIGEEILEFRTYLDEPDFCEEAAGGKNPANRDVTSRWEKFSQQEILEDSIVLNCVPLCQHYVRRRYGSALRSDDVVRCAVTMVIALLRQKQVDDASVILRNLGFEVHCKLKEFCVLTLEKSLRHFLIETLNREKIWSEEELREIRHLDMMETVYSCQSVHRSQEILKEAGRSLLTDSLALTTSTLVSGAPGVLVSGAPGVLVSGAPGALVSGAPGVLVSGAPGAPGALGEIGDSDEVEERNCESPNYSHLSLAITADWDSRTIQAILLERTYTSKGSSTKSRLEPFVVWTFLTRRCYTDVLLPWIRCQFSPPDEDEDTAPRRSWPCGLAINQEMVDAVEGGLTHVRQSLLDEFAKYGVFCSRELCDFHQLILRLSRIGAAVGAPQRDLDTSVAPSIGHLPNEEYRFRLAHYLVEKKLVAVLYHCLIRYRLDTGRAPDELGRRLESLATHHSWLDLMLNVLKLKKGEAAGSNKCNKVILDIGASNERFLNGRSSADVVSMVTDGRPMAAFATLAYSQYSWSELITGVDTPHGRINSDLLAAIMDDYPKLLATSHHKSGGVEKRLDVYTLLQTDCPLNVTRVLGWQSGDVAATGGTYTEMPNFSMLRLQSDYGLKEELNPVYYLRQGRPAFAYTSFINSQSDKSKIGAKPLSVACMNARILAIRSFLSPAMVAACVAYIHMLGGDSLLLMVYVHVAGTLYTQRVRAVSGTPNVRKETNKVEQLAVADSMLRCLRQRRQAAELVLNELSEGLASQIERDTAKQCSTASSLLWHPVLLFCRLHALPLDTTYLVWCARQDDWLHFLTFAQLHQFPAQQLLAILTNFPSRHLREHLSYVVTNINSKQDESKAQNLGSSLDRQTANVRRKLLSRVLVLEERTGPGQQESSSESETEAETGKEQEAVDGLCPHSGTSDEDLFAIVFSCLSKAWPCQAILHRAVELRNPVLTVLAACFETSSYLDCMCCYLRCYLPPSTKGDGRCCCSDYMLNDLHALTDSLMEYGRPLVLAKAYSVFIPESCLIPLFKFCVEVRNRNWPSAKAYLNQFKTAMELMKTTLDNSDDAPPADWTSQSVAMVIKRLLGTLERSEDGYQATSLLSQAVVHSGLRGRGLPDLEKLSRLLHIARERGVNLNCGLLLASDTYGEHCQQVVDQLLQAAFYDDARHFAKRAGIDTVQVTLRQVESRMEQVMESSVWLSEHGRLFFWKDCDQIFTKHRLPPEVVARFYQEHTGMNGYTEKVYLRSTACRWLALTDLASSRHEAKVALWRAQIEYEVNRGLGNVQEINETDVIYSSPELAERSSCSSKQDLLVYSHVTRRSQRMDLSEQECRGLSLLLDKLLLRGQLMEACALAGEFGHYSRELAIIMTCIGLAIGELDVTQIDHELWASPSGGHVTSVHGWRGPRSSQTLSLSPGTSLQSASKGGLSHQVRTTLAAMTSLFNQCENGHQCCARIVTTYAISQVLDRSYASVMMKEENEVLEALLRCSHWNKFDLAKDFILTSGMSDDEVSVFLADHVTRLLATECVEALSTGMDDSTDETWKNLVRLCSEPASLGQRLLETASSRLEDGDSTQADRVLDVELLIRAHDCFTVACHMEGISEVLRAARKLTAKLVSPNGFSLTIRLLMGIARYSEMTYIFDLLKHHQEFLLLFKKGMEKDSRLKMAVLDYLKRFHPSDLETYNMMALHYSMYREIAQFHEAEARKMLRELRSKTLEDCADTVQTLSTIELYLCDAAKSYMKDDCYRQAHSAMKQARLVALQRQLLSSDIHILHLATDSLNKFIVQHEKFIEAYIVAEAYNKKSEWPAALFQRVILESDWTYFSDFKAFLPVTESLVEDAVSRYTLLRTVTDVTIVNMKRFLRYCENAKTRYRLAAACGFSDVTQELLRGEAASYLRDVLGV